MLTNLPEILFREQQVATLSAYIDSNPVLTPYNVFLQGYEGTGKTYTINRLLEGNEEILYTTVYPAESVTLKLLIQAIARATKFTLIDRYPDHFKKEDRESEQLDPLMVEEPYNLLSFFQLLFSKVPEVETFLLVMDGLDSLQDVDYTLLLKLLKLHELVDCIHLKTIYCIRESEYIARYASFMIPTVVFPRYNADQLLQVLISSRFEDLAMDLETVGVDAQAVIVVNFIKQIVQVFHLYTGNNLCALNDLIDLKWDQYRQHIDEKTAYDPVALYKSSIHLFKATNDTLTSEDAQIDEEGGRDEQTYELSTISKYLLIAAYFCSYIEPRYDASLFTKRSHLKSGRSSYGRRKKRSTNPRNLQPNLFFIDRLLAVWQAIYPVDSTHQAGSLASLLQEKLPRANVEVFQNLAELRALKLVSTATNRITDPLNNKAKWKVNVAWEIIKEVAQSVQFDIGSYFSGVDDA